MLFPLFIAWENVYSPSLSTSLFPWPWPPSPPPRMRSSSASPQVWRLAPGRGAGLKRTKSSGQEWCYSGLLSAQGFWLKLTCRCPELPWFRKLSYHENFHFWQAPPQKELPTRIIFICISSQITLLAYVIWIQNPNHKKAGLLLEIPKRFYYDYYFFH